MSAERKASQAGTAISPMTKWEAEQTSQHNKTTRYYYLDNPLTEGEWRIFADLV